MRFHRTYPLWLHILHLIYHGSISLYQLVGFISSFGSSNNNLYISESPGPGWRFRYVTTWILYLFAFYIAAAFLFDIILILRGIDDIIIQRIKIHLDRWFCLMFSTCVGLGFFFHILFFIACKNENHCPKYTDTLWYIHLMPFWYGFAEYLFVPHNTKRDIKTTPILVFIFCFIYFINYWLFVAQTHGHHPYGDPWSVGRWIIYFCFPFTMLVLRLLDLVRERLYYKRGLRAPCIYPPQELHTNPWIGWHVNYAQLNESNIKPIDWKAIILMSVILCTLVTIWNISYLITS